MENETNVTETEEVDYVAAIQELKNNSVPKDKYSKLKEENSKLLKSLINGETIDVEQPQEADVGQLRKELYSGDVENTNLDYIEKTLKLRDELIARGEPDPFLPFGHHISPTNEDVEAANRVAKVLKDCLDYADGDSAIFTNELQRVMIDTAPRARK